MPFPAYVAPIEFQIIYYLSDAEKKLANITDQKLSNHKSFSVLFKLAVYLFNHLRIHPFVH